MELEKNHNEANCMDLLYDTITTNFEGKTLMI